METGYKFLVRKSYKETIVFKCYNAIFVDICRQTIVDHSRRGSAILPITQLWVRTTSPRWGSERWCRRNHI